MQKYTNTKDKIDSLESEINELEASDVYINIQDIDDKDEYFEGLKAQLEEECERLEKELRQLKMSLIVFTQLYNIDGELSNDDLVPREKMRTGEAKTKKGNDSDDYWTEEF